MGHIICKKCGKSKTFPEFRFTGKGKGKKRVPGSARTDICLECEKNKK
jgi:hypothetical protein